MDERIVTALNYIETNYKKTLDLKKVSKQANLSIYHFHRLFKAETGVPLRQFVELLKIEKAYHDIMTTDVDVKKLAYELGYNDYETFARAFKRLHKMSPTLFKSILDDARKGVASNVPGIRTVTFKMEDTSEDAIAAQVNNQLKDTPGINDQTQVKVYVVKTTHPSTGTDGKAGKTVYHWQSVLENFKLKKSS